MNELMEYLYKAEGTELHINDWEKDITTPAGIYRYSHPDADIFKYIDKVAAELGIVYDSSTWSSSIVAKVDEALDKEIVDSLVREFYSKYLEGAHLELFNGKCELVAYSLYVNSPVLMWKSVQRALRALSESGRISIDLGKLSTIDGFYGSKTANGLKCANDELTGYEVEDSILVAAMYEYITLWKKDQDKYSGFLYGWAGRVEKLSRD